MRILVLHHGISSLSWLCRALRYEHVDAILFNPGKPDSTNDIHQKITTAAALAVYLPKEVPERFLQIAKAIKFEHSAMPLIAIHEETVPRPMDEAELNFGAPYDFRAMAAQLKKCIYSHNGNSKKIKKSNDNILRVGDLELDPDTRMVRWQTAEIELRNKEFALLEFLMLNRGKILTRDMILDQVWDRNSNVVSNTVDVHMNSLRRKLKNMGKKKIIHTIPCVGYKLDAKP